MAEQVLVVVAHPDDEISMGASIARFADEGHVVSVLALADGETSRIGAGEKAVLDRGYKQREAAKVLGCDVLSGARFPDQRLDTVALLDITRVVESAIARVKPSIVYTHSLGDLNADHRRVHEAVLPAVRPKSGVREVYAFEGPRMMRPFAPTSFVEVKPNHLLRQGGALKCYGDELIAEWPLMRARACDHGYQAGVPFAEGFETIRRTT